jgi:protein-S-isoprenylcysteine O-methyltransferase Ste14
MTRWGVGPKFTLISVLYGAVVFGLHYFYFPAFTFILISRWVNVILGIILMLVGIPIFIISGIMVHKYIDEGELCTTGVYSYFRHPVYASWIVFIMPGIVIVTGSILGISIPVFMYIVFRIFIGEEEEYLRKKFGDNYLKYEKEVYSVLPRKWKK